MPPPNKNASEKNDKLEDCDEKRELPIKAAFARKAVSNNLCIDVMQLFLVDKSPICTGLV